MHSVFKWLSAAAIFLVADGPMAVDVLAQVVEAAEPILQVEGMLEEGDDTFPEDRTLYDTYTFEGQAGQSISIVMESLEFDTYLLLRSPEGEVIAQNDDYEDITRNSGIVLTLPVDGVYTVIANAHGAHSRGDYTVSAVPVASPQSVPVFSEVAQKQSEAYQTNREGLQLARAGDFQQSLDRFTQALEIYQAVGDREGVAIALNNVGNVYDNLGRYERALETYERALAIHQALGNRSGAATVLNNIATVHFQLGQYQRALESFQQILVIRQEAGDRLGSGQILNNIGIVYDGTGQYPLALEAYEQALAIFQSEAIRTASPQESRRGEGIILNNIGSVYSNLGQYPLALEAFEQALAIRREVGDRSGEGTTLSNIGGVYDSLARYEETLESYQRALAIHQETGDRQAEETTLNNIGLSYDRLGQYQQALDLYQQSLTISRELGNPSSAAVTLNNIASLYSNWGRYEQALDIFQQALTTQRELGDRAGEGTTLGNIGLVYSNLGDYSRALKTYEQALAIRREIGDRDGEAATLNNIGTAYITLGQYSEALAILQAVQAIGRAIGAPAVEADALNNISTVYDNLGQYERALDSYQQALAIRQEIGDRKGEGVTLNNIGTIYRSLGQYPQSLDTFQQVLTIFQEIGARADEATTLNNIGVIYGDLQQPQKSLDTYQQALTIHQELGNRAGIGTALQNIGKAHYQLGQYPEALAFYQQALTTGEEIGSQAIKAAALNGMGTTYHERGEYESALAVYQQALVIRQTVGDRAGIGQSASDIGDTLSALEQPELAIFFLKQSVNQYEAIRSDIRGLSTDQQQSFADTIASTYRRLADLLLQQNRVLEAQQILDLLKVQELDDYLGTVRGEPDAQITILRPEAAILDKYQEIQQSVIALNREQDTIQTRIRETGELSNADQVRLTQIDDILSELGRQFQAFIDDPEVRDLINDLSFEAREQAVPLGKLASLQDNLGDLNAVLLYPLVLEDRIELIITTPDSTPLQRTVAVGRADLNEAVVAFRQALDDPTSNPLPSSQRLYELLIAPIEQDLADAGLDTIIYAPDGALRYIPLAALHDGESWLTERFKVNHITAASLDELTRLAQPQPNILAGAFADPALSYTLPVGDRSLPFAGLPFAGEEVKTLVDTVPTVSAHYDEAFDLDALKPLVGAYNVLHFATHAAFVPENPIASFILSGNGTPLSLQSLREEWDLIGIDLVVLSACETGLGGFDNNGEQVLGLGYVFQSKGARAVLSSLWQVNDQGTQELMNAFYAALQQGESKSQALQIAQRSLIVGEGITTSQEAEAAQSGEPATITLAGSGVDFSGLSHPHYWAPFILIGNGL